MNSSHQPPGSTGSTGSTGASSRWEVLVVGGGHAGVEAALASARLGRATALLTQRLDRVGEMSCNPCIGGLGKGQLAREVDALGGVMGLAADATGIQFRMLNTAKGHAVRAPRAQVDRHLYREEVTRRVLAADGLELIEGSASRLVVVEGRAGARVVGVELEAGRVLHADAVILTTGTFLDAVMHTGESQSTGGRVGEAASRGLSGELVGLGLSLARLKTGTPPRLAREGIDWEGLESHGGDEQAQPFSFATERDAAFPALAQVDCHLTWTTSRTHEIIRANIHRAPMYAGRIQGVGPRYCPSVEDKVMRFAERDRHQVFLEPEGLETDVIYVNGVSTSLPAEVQEEFVHSIPGLERARFLRHGYAVEYDFVQPHQLEPTLAVSSVEGLYLAGQINGTSGYEEAAAQGLLAGANAALAVGGEAPLVLGRDEAYAGVLIDDLVLSSPSEPYRMFSSRAEHRLLLRQDDADRRLTPRARELGLASEERALRLAARLARVAAALELLESLRSPEHGGRSLVEVLRRPEVSLSELEGRHAELGALGLGPDDRTTVEADVKYAGYIERARRDVVRMQRQESVAIPSDLEVGELGGLRIEAREKLTLLRPRTLGAAARIAGINPPDVALLAVYIERHRRSAKGAGSTEQ